MTTLVHAYYSLCTCRDIDLRESSQTFTKLRPPQTFKSSVHQVFNESRDVFVEADEVMDKVRNQTHEILNLMKQAVQSSSEVRSLL